MKPTRAGAKEVIVRVRFPGDPWEGHARQQKARGNFRTRLKKKANSHYQNNHGNTAGL